MLALPRHEAVYSNLFLLMSFSDSSCFNKVSWLQKGNSVFAGESSKFLLPVWTEHALCCERWSSAPGRAERLCGLKFVVFVRGFISHGESVSESVWPLFLTSSINRHLWEEAEGLWCGIRWKPLVPPLQVVCEAPLFSPATRPLTVGLLTVAVSRAVWGWQVKKDFWIQIFFNPRGMQLAAGTCYRPTL